MTAAVECTCDLPLDGGKVEPNPLCPAHGDPRDTSMAWPLFALESSAAPSAVPTNAPLFVYADAGLEAESLEELWELHETFAQTVRDAAQNKGRIEQELERRALAARPDFSPEAGGGVVLAGERMTVAMTYDREFVYDDTALVTIQAEKLLNEEEFSKLAETKWKWNATTFKQLAKRGGRLAEVLNGARVLKSARPKFEAKERVS